MSKLRSLFHTRIISLINKPYPTTILDRILITINYCNYYMKFTHDGHWRYSPDRALASITGFMIVYSTMWGYQLHDRPVLDTMIQPSETSTSNYQRLSWRSRETRVRNGRWILPTSTYCARRVLLHAVNLRHGTDFPSEGRRATDFITLKIHRHRPGLNPRTLGPVARATRSLLMHRETDTQKWH
jgi:hypothetical protein